MCKDVDYSKVGKGDEVQEPPQSPVKLYVRGTISNTLGLSILFGVSCISEDFLLYCGVALLMQYAVFVLHALPFTSEKYYDLSGSATHLAVVAVSLVAETRVRSPRQLLLSLASVVWMTRLGTFLYCRILRDGRDPRFDTLKKVWLAFLGAWTVQACWVCLIQLPLMLINSRDDTVPLGPVDAVAFVLWWIGFVIECAADVEKLAFRFDPANKNKFITSGVWRYSRHPNYFGEILMWAAIALCVSVAGARASDWTLHFAWLSPAFTAFLLLCATGAPMVDKAGMKKWGNDPAYLHYIKNTSKLVPWFPAPATTSEPLL